MTRKQEILAELRALRINKDNYSITTVRADPYSAVAKLILEKVPNSEVFDGMTFKEVRAYCKQPIMTALYNSKAVPEEAFGKDTEELEAFYACLYELFPGAMAVLDALNARWDSKALYHEWELPDGHLAFVPVMVKVRGNVEYEGLTLPIEFYENASSDSATSLAPNFVHSCDSFAVRYVIENADFTVTHIHDQFDAHPNHIGKVRALYLEAIQIVLEEGMLEKFIGPDYALVPQDIVDYIDGFKNSSYALC